MMTQAEADPPAPPEAEVERLLCALMGIVSARVRTNVLGRLDEIHVLASDALHPKQVVRNIESALSAGLGIVIDRRVVSVAQVRTEEYAALVAPPPDASPARGPASPTGPAGSAGWTPPAAAGPAGPAHADESAVRAGGSPDPGPASDPETLPFVQLRERRYEFVSYDVRNQTNRETVCHVTIARDGEQYTGAGQGSSSQVGRAQAAARGLFAALSAARKRDDLLLENATVVEVQGRSYVLVSAQGLVGRRTDPLTGLAAVQRSPEEAAVLAGLQAVNRWAADE